MRNPFEHRSSDKAERPAESAAPAGAGPEQPAGTEWWQERSDAQPAPQPPVSWADPVGEQPTTSLPAVGDSPADEHPTASLPTVPGDPAATGAAERRPADGWVDPGAGGLGVEPQHPADRATGGWTPYAPPAGTGGTGGTGWSGWDAAAAPIAPIPAQRRAGTGRKAALGGAFLAVALVAGAAGAGTTLAVRGDSSTAGSVPVSTAAAPASVTGSSVQTALAKAQPSVVLITSTLGSTGGRGFFGGGGTGGTAQGTGVILTADGQLVTNAHVVNGATAIKVTVPGKGDYKATVVGADTSQDLAVLQMQNASGLTPAEFAASSTVHVGDQVIAIGNAEGYGGSPSVTTGIISATNRSLSGDSSGQNLTGLLQTDAAINPGNSGGPLVDTAGRVVGINTAVATGTSTEPAQGIGFAIPSDTVAKALPQLKAGKSTSGSTQPTGKGGYLGVQITDAGNGAGVVAVTAGSPAATAGLQSGDVVTAIDGTAVAGSSALRTAIQAHKPGDRVTLTVDRNGAQQSIAVTLGTTPSTTG